MGVNKRTAQGFGPERRPEKARIHTGGGARLQNWSLRAMRCIERILQPGDRLLYSGAIHWVVSDRRWRRPRRRFGDITVAARARRWRQSIGLVRLEFSNKLTAR